MPVNPTDDIETQSPEAVLFARAQAGCSATLNYLMARHDGLVQAVVRRQVLGDLPFEEALQAGRIGLWRAILGFGPQRGYAFSTYAWTSIARHIWRAVETYARQESPSPYPLPSCRTRPLSGRRRPFNRPSRRWSTAWSPVWPTSSPPATDWTVGLRRSTGKSGPRWA